MVHGARCKAEDFESKRVRFFIQQTNILNGLLAPCLLHCDSFLSAMSRKIPLTPACLLFGLSLLAIGLWPFNFRIDNHADLLPDAGGLKFEAPAESSKRDLGGMAFTANPLACRAQSSCEAGALTIEIELKAENELSPCVKRIVEVRRPDGKTAFYLGQWKSSLIVRSFNTPPAKGKPYREIGAGGVLAAGRESLVTLVSGPHGTDIHVDGQLIRNSPDVRLLKENETLEGHRLYLGNSPDLGCPWAGSVTGFALFGEEWPPPEAVEGSYPAAAGAFACGNRRAEAMACYRFDHLEGESIGDLSGSANDLWKPSRLTFDKPLLGLPEGQTFSVSDVTVNLLGFVPFGFLVCLRLLAAGRSSPRSCLIIAIAAGFSFSLAIELTQVWLPGRDSSFLDLTTNTMGSAIGGVMAGHFGRLMGHF